MHVGILFGLLIFQATQISYGPGIVFAMNVLQVAIEAKHKICLTVCHAQNIKIGFGCKIALVLKRIKFRSSFLKFLDFFQVACLGNIHHQHLIWGCIQNRNSKFKTDNYLYAIILIHGATNNLRKSQ